MPNPGDYHAFKSTSGNSCDTPGCGTKVFIALAALYGLLWLISKLT